MTTMIEEIDTGLGASVDRAAQGDEAAFVRIVEAHHPDLLRVAFVICGDADLAAETAQATWTIAWRQLDRLRDRTRLRSWLVSIAANEARRLVRGRNRRTVMELAVVSPEGDRGQGDPGLRVEDIDLANALARLDPDDRALLALRYVAGFDSFELAKATGRSPSGTRARLARLIDRLRKDLGDD